MVKRPRVYRDLLAQIAAVREIARRVPIEVSAGVMAAASGQTDAEDTLTSAATEREPTGPQAAHRALYDQQELEARMTWAKSLRGEAGTGILAELQRVHRLGPLRDLSVGGSSLEMAQLRIDFPTFAHVLDYVWGRVLLGRMTSPPAVHLPPLLLNGPPGTGKTAFSKRVANWLNVPVFEVDVATLETSFRLTGLDAGYSTGKPGLIWQALQTRSMSPVVVLDELDKRPDSTRDSGLSFLLGVLEPASAARFQDAYVGLPVDASQITWIATCNDLQNIEPALRSRFRAFDIAPPSRDQMSAVITSVYKALRQRERWGHVFPESLPCEVSDQFIDSSPRDVWQALEDACAKAAAAGRRHLVREDVAPKSAGGPRRGIGFLAGNDASAGRSRRLP